MSHTKPPLPQPGPATGQLSRWFRGVRFPERFVLLVLLLLGSSVWIFVGLADWVQEGRTQKLDEQILRALRRPDNPAIPIGPSWVQETARDITSLGSAVIVSLVTGGVLGFLAISRRWRASILVLTCVAGGVLASFSLKQFFARARPSLIPHLDQVSSFSFPSGHSVLSAVTYLTLGALLARGTKDRVLKLYLITLAGALVFLIGFSRVLLGVHYPSDVLAGWCVGLAWALFCAVIMRWLQQRGKVEPASSTAPSNTDEID